MTDSQQSQTPRAGRDEGRSERPRGTREEGRPQGGRFGGAQSERGDRSEREGSRRPPGGGRRGGGGGGRFGSRRKVCNFCVDGIAHVDYKDISRLRRHVGERGKIEPRRKTGTCAKHQRSLTVAVKRARYIALLPFTSAPPRG